MGIRFGPKSNPKILVPVNHYKGNPVNLRCITPSTLHSKFPSTSLLHIHQCFQFFSLKATKRSSAGSAKLVQNFIEMVMQGEATFPPHSLIFVFSKSYNDRFHGCAHQASMVRLEKNLMALMDLPHWLIPSLASAKYQPLCAFTRIFVAKQCLKDSTFIYCCIIGEAINFEIGRCFFQRSWLGTRKDFCKMG